MSVWERWCPQSALRATTAKKLSGLEKKIYERIVCVWFLAGGTFISVHPLDLLVNVRIGVVLYVNHGSAPVCDGALIFEVLFMRNEK